MEPHGPLLPGLSRAFAGVPRPPPQAMSAPAATYHTRVRGLWSPRHTLLQTVDGEERPLGVLTVRRNRWGMVVAGQYRPERGEVLEFRRDPGLLRAQFSVWTEGREWLGSSLRWNVGRRQIDVWTGGKPYRIVPRSGFRRGWRVMATKTGQVAAIRAGWLGRGCTIELFRKMDLELLLFCYFLGSLTLVESMPPTSLDLVGRGDGHSPAPSRA